MGLGSTWWQDEGKAHFALAVRVARGILRDNGMDSDHGQDVAQDVLVTLEQHPSRQEYSKRFVVATARNRAYDYVRAEIVRDKRDRKARPLVPMFEPSPSKRAALESLMDGWPDGCATAFRLHLEGWSGPEIAEELGIRPGAARQRLTEARKLLRAAFAEDDR